MVSAWFRVRVSNLQGVGVGVRSGLGFCTMVMD